jgi:hypothetical protein
VLELGGGFALLGFGRGGWRLESWSLVFWCFGILASWRYGVQCSGCLLPLGVALLGVFGVPVAGLCLVAWLGYVSVVGERLCSTALHSLLFAFSSYMRLLSA